MSGEVELQMWLHEYKLKALSAVLEEQGSSIQQRRLDLKQRFWDALADQQLTTADSLPVHETEEMSPPSGPAM